MLQAETKTHLETVEKIIRNCLDKDTPDIPASYKTFQTRLENIESTLRNSLEERRIHKLSRLTPHSHTRTLRAHTPYTYTRESQAKRYTGTKGYVPYRSPESGRKGKRLTGASLYKQGWKMSLTIRQSLLLSTPLANTPTSTPPSQLQHEIIPSRNSKIKKILLHLVSRIKLSI